MLPDYELFDSGGEMKLERFGSKLIARPSSLAIWKKHKTQDDWRKADATFNPERGWQFRSGAFERWQIEFLGARFELLLQKSGQIGIFPDHLLYAQDLLQAQNGLSNARVLNLFAYTGVASVLAAQRGAALTHVDLSKSACTWCKRNLELNQLKHVRLICDDALKFAARERKRGALYDIVISDPPSFGRISKSKSWKLEEIVVPHLQDLFAILAPGGTLFFTSHHALLEAQVMANIISDLAPAAARVKPQALYISESGSARKLPAGHLVVCETLG